MPDDLDVLSTVDAEFPVTDEFISRVRRGVRRRRAARAALAGGVAVAVIAVLTLVVPQLRRPAPPAPAAPVAAPLDGVRIGYVPRGLHAADRDDSAVYRVIENHLRTEDTMAPMIEEPTATYAMRAFLRDNGGKWLWITVMRPLRTTREADRATVTRWLAGSATAGAVVTEAFAVPLGSAVLTTMVGSEVTTHDIVITAPDGTVVTVGANAGLGVPEMKAVANALTT